MVVVEGNLRVRRPGWAQLGGSHTSLVPALAQLRADQASSLSGILPTWQAGIASQQSDLPAARLNTWLPRVPRDPCRGRHEVFHHLTLEVPELLAKAGPQASSDSREEGQPAEGSSSLPRREGGGRRAPPPGFHRKCGLTTWARARPDAPAPDAGQRPHLPGLLVSSIRPDKNSGGVRSLKSEMQTL